MNKRSFLLTVTSFLAFLKSEASKSSAGGRGLSRHLPRPHMTHEDALNLIPSCLHHEPTVLLGIRGYYAKEVGTGRNLFNSAFFVVTREGVWGFRGNTLPSRYGKNEAIGRYFPVLLPGVYKLKVESYVSPVSRKRKPALTQLSPMNLRRDDGTVETGVQVGIHVHSSGSEYFTGSWGCGTLPPSEFEDFYKKFTPGATIPYVLSEAT